MIAIVCTMFLLAAAPQEPGSPAVYELSSPPAIDGDLSDWSSVPTFPIPGTLGADLEVRARLAWDDRRLYVALEVEDDTLAAPERAWRYGDGFYLTVLAPGAADSSRSHISFGFARTADGPPERRVVNRSGEYFPSVDLTGVELAIRPSSAELRLESPVAFDGVVRYEAAIPWSLLAPADPLLADSLRVNIVVVDRDGGTDRQWAKLHLDGGHDTERTPYRKAARLPLVRREAAGAPRLAVRVDRPVLDPAEAAQVHVAGRALPAGARARVKLVQEDMAIAIWEGDLPRGGDVARRSVRLGPAPSGRTGPATLVAELHMPGGGPPLTTEHPVFLVDGSELDRVDAELAAMEGVVGLAGSAAPAAAIRIQWLREHAASAPANAPFEIPSAWWSEVETRLHALREQRPDFVHEPGVHLVAHRSAIDGTLQPYSVFLPPGFDPERSEPYPTLVALHGSGVDERWTVRSAAAMAGPRGWIVVAPRGRGLSDWWIGAAETDVLEALDHARELFPIDADRLYLAGFSMGGYGAWRLALRQGERFRGVAVMAGATCPAIDAEGECVEQLIARRLERPGGPPPLLVLHGARDTAVPVAGARALVDRLDAIGWAHQYREEAEAGHGHVDWWSVAGAWLATLP